MDQEVFSLADRTTQAKKALTKDLTPGVFRAMVRDVQNKLDQLQGFLFPQMAMNILERMIDKHSPCEQTETFRREMLASLREGSDAGSAFEKALKDTFDAGIMQADERLKVHCIEVDEKREKRCLESNLRKNHEQVFDGISADFLKEVVLGKVQLPLISAVSRIKSGPSLP